MCARLAGTPTSGITTSAPRVAASAITNRQAAWANRPLWALPSSRSPTTAPTTTEVAETQVTHARPDDQAASAVAAIAAAVAALVPVAPPTPVAADAPVAAGTQEMMPSP